MSKFRKGDRVRVIDRYNDDPFQIGDILIVDERSCVPFCIRESDGLRKSMLEDELELIGEPSMDNLQPGDVLVNEGYTDRIVQGTVGEVVFIVHDDQARPSQHYSVTELKTIGWKLKDTTEVKEMTVADVEKLVGQKVKIVKG